MKRWLLIGASVGLLGGCAHRTPCAGACEEGAVCAPDGTCIVDETHALQRFVHFEDRHAFDWRVDGRATESGRRFELGGRLAPAILLRFPGVDESERVVGAVLRLSLGPPAGETREAQVVVTAMRADARGERFRVTSRPVRRAVSARAGRAVDIDVAEAAQAIAPGAPIDLRIEVRSSSRLAMDGPEAYDALVRPKLSLTLQ